MDKFLELLEAHCQWLAVGLGGLFLGWMLWSYALMTPVAVPSGDGTDLTPGNVDDWVKRKYAEDVAAKIAQPGTEEAPESVKTSPIKPWWNTFSGSAATLPKDSAIAFNSPPSDATLVSGPARTVDAGPKVASLPTLPSAHIEEALAKRAYVGPVVLPGQPAEVPPVQPVQPVAGAPGAPQTAPIPPGHDLSYVRVSFTVDPAALDKSFQAVNIRTTDSNTGFVGIKLMRREKIGEDKWSEPVEIPYIKNGVGIWPPPLNNVGRATVNQFRQWSDSPQGMLDILRPSFYTVVFGEGPWDPNSDDNLPTYDPAAEIRRKQEEYKKLQEQKRQAAPPVMRTPPGGIGRGKRGSPADAPAGNDPQRPASLGGVIQTQFRPGTPPPPPGMGGPNPAGIPRQPGVDGETPMDGTQPGMQPGQGQPPANGLPSPVFQPALVTQPIYCWTYDETVVEGHTYQYQVVYALRNPVYDSNAAIVADVKLGQVFAIWSEVKPDAWSQDVNVKPTAEFYLAGTNWRQGSVPPSIKINVFKWALGKWQMETFNVFPGDPVGGKGVNNVDFGTGYTLVEMRDDPRGNSGRGKPFVLFLKPDGLLEEREPTVDNANQRMLKLRGAIEAAKAAAAGTAPPAGIPGTPGGAVPGQPGVD
ncbi:MAG: hypothetical protein QM754_17105 [Tepidisphaeraceae bacterium]